MNKIVAFEITDEEYSAMVEKASHIDLEEIEARKVKSTCGECDYHMNIGEWGSPTFCSCRRSDHFGHYLIEAHPACQWQNIPRRPVLHR